MYHRYKDFGYFGVTDWLCDNYGLIAWIIGITSFIVVCYINPQFWWCGLLISPFIGWSGPIVLTFLSGLIELCIWYIYHPKDLFNVFRNYKNNIVKWWYKIKTADRKKYLDWVFTLCVICAGIIIPFKTTRFCASHFCDPEPWNWEYAYVSQSPKARAYHWEESCKMLNNTKYDIVLMSGNEAEDYGLYPCKVCMQNSTKKEYDVLAIFLIIPCCLALARCVDKISEFFRTYTFRNPIVKRN